MKKIIFVSHLQIFPPMSGGQLRSANLCCGLAKLGHHVEVHSLTGRKSDYLKLRSSFKHDVNSNLSEYVDMNPIWGILQFISYRINIPPFWITFVLRLFTPCKLKMALKSADIVILDFPYLHSLVLDNKTVWINTHNAEFELWKEHKFLSAKVKKLEVTAFRKNVRLLFCNDLDRQKFLTEIPNLVEKSIIVPNGIDLKSITFNHEQRLQFRRQIGIRDEQNVFLYTASSFGPNKASFELLRKFCDRNEQALINMNILFLVVGTVSDSVFTTPVLKVTGRVAEISPYFGVADFCLNPVQQGSGVNVKMIEYIASRLVILSTETGSRGLKLQDKKSFLMFDENSLLRVLETALKLDNPEKMQMTELALRDNEDQIDMTRSLEQLLNRMT